MLITKIEREKVLRQHIGYEPAGLTVHPLPELPRVGSFFSYTALYIYKLVFPKNVLKGKPEYFGVI